MYERPDEPYYLCYSGGKDSDCIRILAALADVKHDITHNLTTVDAPETMQYIKSRDKGTVEKSLSPQNIEKLKSTYENIGNLLSEAGESEVNMTKSETEKLIKQAITEFNKADENPPEAQKPDEVTKEFVVDTVNKMLSDIKKSEEETVTEADVVEMIQKALEPIFQARGIPTNLNSETEQVQKSSEHYLHGII